MAVRAEARRQETAGHTLELRKLVKVFQVGSDREVRAVNELDLRCEPGELISLCGPSGCGKTTALRLVAGLETPTSGEIYLGEKLLNDKPANHRNIGMVFQSYALFPHMTVFNNVAYPLQIRKVPKDVIAKQVDEVLQLVGLRELKDRHPNRMSGGQQQRVALARALVCQPDLLLFDEPLSNLDAKLRLNVRTEIRQLQQRYGITTLYVTHDQNEAMAISDRIAIMKDGVILQLGRPDELYNHPVNRFVADFLGRANFVEGVVKDVENDKLAVETELGLTLHPPKPKFACSKGQKVTLVIRPEVVHPQRAQDGPAVVSHVEFQGSFIEYRIAVRGLELQVTNLSSDPEVFAVGSKVALNITEDHIAVLQD